MTASSPAADRPTSVGADDPTHAAELTVLLVPVEFGRLAGSAAPPWWRRIASRISATTRKHSS
jgi:hypothetical protein